MLPEKEAMLYEQLSDNRVRCSLCGRRCVIPEGVIGFCRVRKNVNGRLISLVYGRACSTNRDPIEKKPLFHFHPGSHVFSIATVGCNFRCRFCDNWSISQEEHIFGSNLSPSKLVALAEQSNCQGISYTYTEPTIFFEYAYDTAKLAHEVGLFNTFVTNGYMTPEAVETIAPYLDAATVDFKGGGDPHFYQIFSAVPDVTPIYTCLTEMKKHHIHIEITNLIVPEGGDSIESIRALSSWICNNLGAETPTHFLRFHPSYDAIDLPLTPVRDVERAREIALEEGLYYVYTGNIQGHGGENTYCPKCHETLVERWGFNIIRWHLLPDLTCPTCHSKIAIVGKPTI